MCSVCSQKPSSPPDGVWADTVDNIVMSGRVRIYADKFWRACSLGTCAYPYVDVFLQIDDSAKIPANHKVYWYLLDPDDSADNITVDPNGALPNDNVLRGRLLSCQHQIVDSLSDTLVSTQLDSGYPSRTSIRLAVPPKPQTPDSFYGGDDFILKVKLGSQSSNDSMISTRMYVWKMMRAEVDCCQPESVNLLVEVVDSLYKLVRNPLTGLPFNGGNWDPNRCLYVDARRQDVIDNFYHWVPSHMTPDTTQPLVVAFANYLSQFVNYPNDYVYVHIAGDADWADTTRWGPYPMGLATVGPGFSVVFAETAYARLAREGDTLEQHLIIGVYKVIMHELGHQFMTRDHCGTYGCIMWPSITYFDADPHYCPHCVIWARDSAKITQFRR
jgi:hypothetical protein